jgi:translation elongation factor EF-Ts
VKKIATERALLEQPYLIDGSKTVAEAVKATIAAVGENVQVRRRAAAGGAASFWLMRGEGCAELAPTPSPAPHLSRSSRLVSPPRPPQVRRFERFVLGEGLEKKVNDLAADVAAATGGKV